MVILVQDGKEVNAEDIKLNEELSKTILMCVVQK